MLRGGHRGRLHAQRGSRRPAQAAGSAAIQVGQHRPGNLKTMLSDAFKSFGYSKYADRYLGAFAYRFNRRFDLSDLVVRLVVDVCRTKATPQRVFGRRKFISNEERNYK